MPMLSAAFGYNLLPKQLKFQSLILDKNIPIVFLTAVITEEEVASRGYVIGGYPFIAKPVHIQKLVNLVEKILP